MRDTVLLSRTPSRLFGLAVLGMVLLLPLHPLEGQGDKRTKKRPREKEQVELVGVSPIQGTDRYDFVVKDIEAQLVLVSLVQIGGLKAILNEGLRGNITLRLPNVTAKEAFDAVVGAMGFRVEEREGVLFVSPGGFRAKARESKIFRLKNRSVDVVEPRVRKFLSPHGTLVADEVTQKLYVEDYPQVLEQIETMIADLDQPLPEPLELEFQFELLVASKSDRDAVPPEISEIVKTLTDIFHYNHFELLDTAFVRCTVPGKVSLPIGGAVSATAVADKQGGKSSQIDPALRRMPYNLEFQVIEPHDEAGQKIPLRPLKLVRQIPFVQSHTITSAASSTGGKAGQTTTTQVNFEEVGITTSLTLSLGEHTVVGGSKLDGDGKALILLVKVTRK